MGAFGERALIAAPPQAHGRVMAGQQLGLW
jgi:hypothetical protein